MLFFHLALDTPVGEDGENTIGDLAADSFNQEQSITDRMQQRELEAVLWHCRVTFGATGENNPAA